MAEWDHEVDLVVVGSGAGAMTSALRAHDLGCQVLLLEKTDLYGGSSAMSGGAAWIPNNHLMAEVGITDSTKEALCYLKSVSGGLISDDNIQAYVDSAPKMLSYLSDNTDVVFSPLSKYPDYYPEREGAKPGARSLEPVPFDSRKLGDEIASLRPSHPQELMFGKVGLTAAESHTLVQGSWRSRWVAFQIMFRYYLGRALKRHTDRDSRLTLGNALIGRLRYSLMRRDVPIWLNADVRELVVENDRVVGVIAIRDGRSMRVRAAGGVLLAAGGFARNETMRAQYQRQPISDTWSAASPANVGDGIRMGQAIGARVTQMDDAWWTPVTIIPGKAFAWLLVVEKSMPGSIIVNRAGKRFTNEAAPYVDVVNGIYSAHAPDSPSIPAYLIFDGRYRRKYPAGPIAPGSVQPDSKVSRRLRDGFLKRANSLEELADLLGLDTEGLIQTVALFNENAKRGVDPDFDRGKSLYDRYYSDPGVKPNPCLAPLKEAPFYAFEVYPGDLGTKGGLETDDSARVIDEHGLPIEGLYATGNCSATIMGPSYPGAGGTIGPAMTFGFVAAGAVAASKGRWTSSIDEAVETVLSASPDVRQAI